MMMVNNVKINTSTENDNAKVKVREAYDLCQKGLLRKFVTKQNSFMPSNLRGFLLGEDVRNRNLNIKKRYELLFGKWGGREGGRGNQENDIHFTTSPMTRDNDYSKS